MHLWLHDVDGPRLAIEKFALSSNIMYCRSNSYKAIKEALWNGLVAIGQDSISEHVVTNITNQDNRSPWNSSCNAVAISVPNILVHVSCNSNSILNKWCR